MTTLEHALAYAARGWRVAPIPPGWKFPKGIDDWQTRATTDAKRITSYWSRHPDHGTCIVTGVISGLFVVDVDPRHDGHETLADLEHEYGALPDTVETITGGGGRHIYFRMPDDVVITNDAGKRLGPGLDVRGEGGQVVAPPTIHPQTGAAYEWEAMSSPLDGAVVADAPTWLIELLTVDLKPITPRRLTLVGDSDKPGDRFAAENQWADLLTADGWTLHSARNGRQGSYELWTRPGKDPREGASASLYYQGSDVLKVFTSSVPGLNPDETYTKFGYYAAMRHGGDFSAAATELAHQQTPATATVPANVDPETGDITTPMNLPDEFWNARPYLQHIRQAAHARTRSADAVLLFVLARTAALIPPTVVLPAVVGSVASLNFLGGIVSSSGGGKSTSGGVARDLLPIERVDVVADIPPGSGEGLTELYFEWVMEEGPDGKNKRVKRKTKNGAFIYLDEGQALAEMGNRKGATLMPTLRSAWSGETIGQSNATQETYRVLAPHSYRMSIMVGFQLEYAAVLLDDKAGGTPQRFTFATAIDPSVPDIAPEWPGTLHVETPNMIAGGTQMGIDANVAQEIRARDLLGTRGQYEPDALDSHADLVRLKVAALLALLDGRMDINAEDWELAHKVMRASNAVRGWVIEHARIQARKIEENYTAAAIRREAALEGDATARALISGAKSIARKIHRDGETISRSAAGHAASSKHKRLVGVDEMLAYAEQEGWIMSTNDGWKPGESRPA